MLKIATVAMLALLASAAMADESEVVVRSSSPRGFQYPAEADVGTAGAEAGRLAVRAHRMIREPKLSSTEYGERPPVPRRPADAADRDLPPIP